MNAIRLAAVVTLCLGFLAPGCSNDYRYSEVEKREWPASDVSAMEISTFNGRLIVSVDGADPITARIKRWVAARSESDAKARIGKIHIGESFSGRTLKLDADEPRNDLRDYGASFEIATSEVESLDLRTTNGKVIVTGHSGDIDVDTTNGRVSVALKALDPDALVSVSTNNGGIDLYLPIDSSATIDARTTHGSVDVVGFPDSSGKKLGAGEATITLRTKNGGILVQPGSGFETPPDDDDDDADDDDTDND